LQDDLDLESFKLVTEDVPRAFDARSIDTFAEGRTEMEEDDQGQADNKTSEN